MGASGVPEADTAVYHSGGPGVLAEAGWGHGTQNQAAGPSGWAEPWLGC